MEDSKTLKDNNGRKFNIWMIREGEPLPIDGKERLMRLGMLAKYLSERGHKITWWSSSFIHAKKIYYCNSYKEISINPNEQLILLHSNIYYKKNISLPRIIYHQNLAKAFRKYSKRKSIPDLIFCSWPTSQFAKEAVHYGERNKVPVVIDIRDLWPDIFCRAFPSKLQWFAKIVLKPLQYSTASILKRATGITGMIPYATNWGCHYAGRSVGKNDATIYIGNNRPCMTDSEWEDNLTWWRKQGISEDTWNICYFGTLSISVDLGTVIDAVRILAKKYSDIRLVIGGEGDCRSILEKRAQDSKHIVFAGWLDEKKMNSLMKISCCGAYSYKNSEDFFNTFSNKGIQYLSAKLPILNSLGGFARKLLDENKCGLTYEEGNVRDCIEQINRIYSDIEMRKQMSENAFELFEKKFESNIVNRQFEEYFYRIMGV